MSRADRRIWMRTVVTMAATALSLLAIRSIAAVQPRVENPHGSFHEECALCHDARGWTPAHVSSKFDHAKYGFPLTGAHATGDCKSCHQTLEFKQPRFLCQSCHEDPHRGEMGTDCARCHSARSFVDRAPMVRAHQLTRFPLTGSHAALECESCHRPAAQGQMQFVGTRAECQSCHMKDYDATRNPDHRASGLPTDCAQCHRTLTWNTKTFDHDRTRFPLTGAHRTTACLQCHGDNVWAGKPTDCVSCHRSNYDASSSPNHASAGFSTQCATCHTTTAWAPASFDHSTTGFALTGAHRSATCAQCHGDGVYAGKATACDACHHSNYASATNPNHASAGFPITCQTCHTTTAWQPSSFNHDATAFPLTGAHRSAACMECHGDNVYAGKPTACATCHQTNFNATTAPNHLASGIPTTCQNCHTTTAWQPASFDHNATSFPLTGAHVAATCNQCHGDGVYAGKPTACDACHHTDYMTATNPNHASAGFSTACQTCHTTTAWQPSTFNHDASWFPIYSGTHLGRWSRCSDCHTNAVDFSVFNCLSCHPHDDKAGTDSHHTGVSGYSYDSASCYRCHPRGRAG